ncbi:KN motif and ankyrin repeat domain-containing protein 4 [Bufo bufo]|uniref:KN motif and ankyrin repeat domain-containing protein 4 n=1 Tax=Bufo bufo TaxID=8384 RepID=UPI001ABDD446|nr:KN motif and ankyrin repeat domain-containing protein 4 [Bufo bufo]XP_040264030.1 KN motif and ankyrin repeat domain-containing protein 4 [Bufo bufo]XP_040264031.1 KN motif and ankyrin repeat domain-containing protein 4 [Bufo bufo]XP_040264032.1 KN motif and ankyrin repeat domain-containing protein 4 [Bufo bufo]XP_040264033.1 KN motif and ankyrin repeat domain-containing protein 4 [Bufo bufo]
MEKTNGENVASKEDLKKKQVSYSVETPYGFHLDLDFLKYVHDIEKGNTIKRIHIHRRAKQSKFSTLPRNFSVPENGSQSYTAASSRTWSPSSYRIDAKDSQVFSGNDSSLRLRYVQELNYRRKDIMSDATLQELAPEDFSGFKDRPQFARASSLPASLPQSTMSSDQSSYFKVTRNLGRFSDSRLGSSEEPVSPSHIQSDKQLAAAFKKIKELEEQIKTIPELQKTIYVLEGKNNKLNTQLKSLSQFLGNIKDQEGADFLESNTKSENLDIGNGEVNGQVSYDNLSDSPFSTIKLQVSDLTKRLDDRAREVHNLRVLVEKQSNELKAKDVYITDLTKTLESAEESRREVSSKHYRDMAVNTDEEEVEEKRESIDKNTYANIGVETHSVGCGVLPGDLDQLPDTDHSLMASNQEDNTTVQDNMLADDNVQVEIEEVTKVDGKEGSPQGCNNNRACDYEDPTNIRHLPTVHQPPADASIGQYVKRIQDLLQEQWTCLEHGYPDLASALKQPANKLSSIQNQLVNSLNLLSSVYSTQTTSERENFKPESQQAEPSPRSLKSIMKKKNSSCRSAGDARAKKNLQFVGVNGGYETTSSEDSSSEDDEDSYGEKTEIAACSQDGDDGGDGHTDNTVPLETGYAEEELSETPGPTISEAQQYLQRCTVGEAFRSECHILSSHLAELRTTTDNKLRQTLYTVCQEWFRVSSQKTSSPDLVAVYLEEFRSISPQLLQAVVNIADENGNTALHYSVSHSNFRIVKLLLNTGVCDVDHQNKAGYTPVMLTPLASAETDEDMEVVKDLLTLGNVNLSASQGGQTALMLGVSHGRSDMVKVLLDCGADVNLAAEDGETALIIACQVGNLDIVKLLISHPDCDVELTDKAGNSALSIVLDSAHSEIAELLQAHTEHRRPCPSTDTGEGGSL